MEYEKWDEVLAPYNNAVEELKVKFKNIRKEFLTKGEYSPIEFVTGRTKKIASIVSKAKRLNIQDIEAEMEDIAGIRIMCQFVEDIYNIVNLIKSRSDMSIVYEKDYIKNFKDSGYRSYHVIIKYPIHSIAGSKEILCEIQIRTLAMNFWATIEHSLKYKYEHYIPETLAVRLRRAADAAFLLDQEMSEIREEIMKAQVMYQSKSLTIREVLSEIQIRTLAMNFWATIEHSLKYKYEHYIPENVALRLRKAADAAFLLDEEMSEIREDIMKAQVMYQVKSVTLRDVLDKIQELYNVGETHKAIKYQRRLDKIDNERDITEILQLKKEIDSLLQEYKNKVDD